MTPDMSAISFSAYTSEQSLSNAIDRAVDGLGLFPLDVDLPDEQKAIWLLRRERSMTPKDSLGILSLVEEDGVLHWEESSGILPRPLAGRRGLWGRKKVIKQLKYPKLGFSQVAQYLEDFDHRLTPFWGLRRWQDKQLKPVEKPSGQRPILLFVHGTFSKNEAIFEQLAATAVGLKFLDKMQANYEILAFDHPTLSVSPMINALDLARVLGNYPLPIDVICHSRGGLVTRWWLETFDSGKHGRRRAVLVGAPLDGTSLAAPNKLRHGIDLLTNIGHILGEGLSLIPFFTVAGGLLKIFSSFGSIVANTPVVDAAVAAIPGLAAMSMSTNNFELNRLNTMIPGTTPPTYFAVASNFEPDSEGWRFWRFFTKAKGQLAHLVTDRLIFEAANDLVVDTESMFRLAGGVLQDDTTRRRLFKNSSIVHHTNYFLQPETIDFIESSLLPEVPPKTSVGAK